jgi:hypothetical protein
MMNELQVKKSNIWHWVSSVRIPHRKNSPNHSMAMAHDYEPRCAAIRKKIRVLISAIDESTNNPIGNRLVIRIGTEIFKGDEILHTLCCAIGVYNIKRWDESNIGQWTQNGTYIIGNEWLDYLGDQSIRKGGGHIVVMLSDEGVKSLNEIAHKLYPFVSTSVV